MPSFRWKGIDSNGVSHRGILCVDTAEQLQKSLLGNGIALLSCSKVHGDSRIKNVSNSFNFHIKRHVSLRVLADFFHDLSITLGSGIPLLPTLKLIEDHTESKKFKTVISVICTKLKQGISLSEALGEHKKIFPELVIQIIRSGEMSGNLQKSFEHINSHLTQKSVLRQKIKNASMSPLITIIFSVCIITSIFIFLVPQLEPLFNSGNSTKSVNLLFSVSNFLQSEQNRIILLTAFIIFFLLLKIFKKINFVSGRFCNSDFKDYIFLKLPIIGQMVVLTNFVHFVKSLSLLLVTGNALKPSLLMASKVCTNSVIRQKIRYAAENINKGQTLEQAFTEDNTRFFPKTFVSTIALGQKTGKLDVILEKYGILLEKRLMNKIKFFTTILQPILLVCVGLFISFLLLQLYLPLFNTTAIAL